MTELKFTSLDEAGFTMLLSWFTDPELQRRFEYPTRIWFNHLCNEPNVHGWIILEEDRPVGRLQLDIHPHQIGYIGYYVNPKLRHQGYGKRILRSFL